MIRHTDISSKALWKFIRNNAICFGGNSRLKIYGTLQCGFGKRMKRENRVFFCSNEEALEPGYRPCGACMKNEYGEWKKMKQKQIIK